MGEWFYSLAIKVKVIPSLRSQRMVSKGCLCHLVQIKYCISKSLYFHSVLAVHESLKGFLMNLMVCF